jgi:transposase, IS6 family
MMECGACRGDRWQKAGRSRQGQQRFRCPTCARRQSVHAASAFRGHRFPDDIIGLAVRWYLTFRLSYAEVAEWLAERGVHVDPFTIYRWVQRFTPLYQAAARRHRRRVGGTWSIDETYIKVAGVPCYVFRAIDQQGQVIDVLVSTTRDTAAAITFLMQAIERTGVRPDTATTDRSPIYPAAFRTVLPGVHHLKGKAIQQRIERDHQHLKGRYRPMRGFKRIGSAQTICAGHGFIRNLREGFYTLGTPQGDPRLPQPPRVMCAWNDLTNTLQAA